MGTGGASSGLVFNFLACPVCGGNIKLNALLVLLNAKLGSHNRGSLKNDGPRGLAFLHG